MTTHQHTNHLAGQTSPYLLQHQHNPVDWYPWGPEALEKARREEKPIFLPIGYSPCHCSHVMERESFQRAEAAPPPHTHRDAATLPRDDRPHLHQLYLPPT